MTVVCVVVTEEFVCLHSGLVPLHNACSYGHYEVTELLLKVGPKSMLGQVMVLQGRDLNQVQVMLEIFLCFMETPHDKTSSISSSIQSQRSIFIFGFSRWRRFHHQFFGDTYAPHT